MSLSIIGTIFLILFVLELHSSPRFPAPLILISIYECNFRIAIQAMFCKQKHKFFDVQRIRELNVAQYHPSMYSIHGGIFVCYSDIPSSAGESRRI